MRRREHKESNWRRGKRGETNKRLITCLASTKDVCSLLISSSY